MVNAFDAVLRRGGKQAAAREVFRRARELRQIPGRTASTKEEDDRGPSIGFLPRGRKIEVHFQIALRCCLVYDGGLVAADLKVGVDRLQGRDHAAGARRIMTVIFSHAERAGQHPARNRTGPALR